MNFSKKKRLVYASGLLSFIGLLLFSIVLYFLVQSVRETFYQNKFEREYDYLSLTEDGVVDPVQVFHGVKLNTFLEEDEASGKKSGDIIFEVKDEPEAKLKGFQVDSGQEGMRAFGDAIQYKMMVEKETGKESFIIAFKKTPDSSPAKYKTYNINENGVISTSEFTLRTKNKLETQWIRGLSGETHGYYTDLPYQKGGTVSLVSLAFLGILSLIGAVWLRRRSAAAEAGEAA
ncbi:hypothetical protein [Rossellomorea aquimaris]|jgi:hypothetical protein|uniref:Uncharacterized protein n=1 Tax=Rossellomorea aquimaris TaxID=189382 RepID=A0A5D4TQ21_9BACI|nr:hypothetical protein [Rossellomorea aquimaris]TYS76512.1 hypothetical protein FZD05_17985 [Rossellomorea aquimaris]TYS83102.1 hypothetical protein FZC85_18580 [Rossellomorea aquimaris]